MIWNRVRKATHNALSVGVYDAIIQFNNSKKANLDTTELLKVDPCYYMTVIYRMFEPKKVKRCGVIQKKATR